MLKQSDGIQCWEAEGTLCNYSALSMIREENTELSKEEACANANCIYYNHAKKLHY